MRNVISEFLLKNGYGKSIQDFNENFLSHPNYPSLYAITDTLSFVGIENVVANVPVDQLDELPNTFLGFIDLNNEGYDLAFVSKNAAKVTVMSADKKRLVFSVKEFKPMWNGVVIAIEAVKKSRTTKDIFFPIKASLAVCLLTLFLFEIHFLFSFFKIASYSLYLMGFFTSLSIIGEKLKKGNESASKLCSFSDNISCDSVIKSKEASIAKWLDFSDLPILFFGIAILSMLINANSYYYINIASLLSVPVVFYSVGVQRFKLNKWCALCLVISFLILSQAALLFFEKLDYSTSLYSLVAACLLVPPGWFFIKYYLEHYAELKNTNSELKRFKRNFELFDLLQKKTVTNSLFSSVEIGNKKNDLKLSLIISPSCNHCHAAFEQAMELSKSLGNRLYIDIFYNLNIDNTDNPYTEIAKNVMQLNKINPENALLALTDWHLKKMSLDDWLKKWRQAEIDNQVIDNLKAQYEWCVKNSFNYTPVKILNNKEYPKEYDLPELKFFISEIEEKSRAVQLI